MSRMRRIALAIAVCLALLPTTAVHAAPGADRAAADRFTSATRIVVRVQPGSSMRGLETRLGNDGARIVRRSADGESALIDVPPGRGSAEYAAAIARALPVQVAEPLRYVTASAVPTDPSYSLQWGLPAIHAPGAWDYGLGSASVVVAVIDSGVDLDHPDLDAQIQLGGWDFVDNDNDPNDVLGHGTHVAGIVAAEANNGVGGSGTAPGCKILPVRVLNALGEGDTFTLAEGIRYATDNGADVINMSLGGESPSTALSLAVAYAIDNDVVVVAAAGNTYNENPSVPAVQYPAREPGVIAVGAVTQTLGIATYSNRDSTLDIVAPGGTTGGFIYSTYIGGGFAYMAGTSMATPFVAGTAALMRSENPAATQAEIAAGLLETARDLGTTGRDDTFGYGLVQADVAVISAHEAPGTILTVSSAPGPSGWYAAAPTVTLTPDRQPVTTNYNWDGDAPSVYTVPLTAPEGTHTLTYWSQDAMATEPAHARQFRVDTTAPSAPAITSATALGTTSVNLAWSTSVDAGIGVSHYTVQAVPSGTALATTAGTSARITGLLPGTAYTFRVVAHDALGHASVASPNQAVSTLPTSVLQPIYRFYNVTNGTHFFTPSATERDAVIATWPGVFSFEGTAYSTYPPNNTQPLYRFYNRVSGSHFYTASSNERDTIIARWPHIFTFEGETYSVTPTAEPGKVAVYRFYNVRNGSHFFTASEAERDTVIANWPFVYSYEGPAFWLGQ